MVKMHGHWIIKSSECLHKDEFVEFRVDDVEGTDGKQSRYATTRMRPGVSVLALDDEGAVYFTKQFRYAIGRESVEAVAGAIDEGEEAETGEVSIEYKGRPLPFSVYRQQEREQGRVVEPKLLEARLKREAAPQPRRKGVALSHPWRDFNYSEEGVRRIV